LVENAAGVSESGADCSRLRAALVAQPSLRVGIVDRKRDRIAGARREGGAHDDMRIRRGERPPKRSGRLPECGQGRHAGQRERASALNEGAACDHAQQVKLIGEDATGRVRGDDAGLTPPRANARRDVAMSRIVTRAYNDGSKPCSSTPSARAARS